LTEICCWNLLERFNFLTTTFVTATDYHSKLLVLYMYPFGVVVRFVHVHYIKFVKVVSDVIYSINRWKQDASWKKKWKEIFPVKIIKNSHYCMDINDKNAAMWRGLRAQNFCGPDPIGGTLWVDFLRGKKEKVERKKKIIKGKRKTEKRRAGERKEDGARGRLLPGPELKGNRRRQRRVEETKARSKV